MRLLVSPFSILTLLLITLGAKAAVHQEPDTIRNRYEDDASGKEFLRSFCQNPEPALCAEHRKNYGDKAPVYALYNKERNAVREKSLTDMANGTRPNGQKWDLDLSKESPGQLLRQMNVVGQELNPVTQTLEPSKITLTKGEMYYQYLLNLEKQMDWDPTSLKEIQNNLIQKIHTLELPVGMVDANNVGGLELKKVLENELSVTEPVSPTWAFKLLGMKQFQVTCGVDGMSMGAIRIGLPPRAAFIVCPGTLVYFAAMGGKQLPLGKTAEKSMAFLTGHELFHGIDNTALNRRFESLYREFLDCLQSRLVPNTLAEQRFRLPAREWIADFGGGLTLADEISKAASPQEKANTLKDALELFCDLPDSDSHPPSQSRLLMLLANEAFSKSIGCSQPAYCSLKGHTIPGTP